MAFGAFMTVFRSSIGSMLSYLFQSEIIKRQISEYLGATINQITNASLKSFCIPLSPHSSEQIAIATALSDADALIEALEQSIAKKRQIKQGAMQELLTGKGRLLDLEGNGKRSLWLMSANVFVEWDITLILTFTALLLKTALGYCVRITSRMIVFFFQMYSMLISGVFLKNKS